MGRRVTRYRPNSQSVGTFLKRLAMRMLEKGSWSCLGCRLSLATICALSASVDRAFSLVQIGKACEGGGN